MNKEELKSGLANFSGSEQVFRHQLANAVYTEGVQFFAQNAGGGAYWLLDIIATEPAILKQAQEFALVTLTVADNKAKLTVSDGNGGPPVFERDIEYTDCPEGGWRFYFIDKTIMLPSEY